MRGHFEHEKAMKEIAENVKNSAYEIIEKKGATYYGIAMKMQDKGHEEVLYHYLSVVII
jgi:L-lactate dehydrogenase